MTKIAHPLLIDEAKAQEIVRYKVPPTCGWLLRVRAEHEPMPDWADYEPHLTRFDFPDGRRMYSMLDMVRIGSGRDREQLLAWALTHGVKVRFPGDRERSAA